MNVTVITPPASFVLPADIAGSHASNDPAITAVIAAATESIDGPTGWLGSCLGGQTLEWATDEWDGDVTRLPFGPVQSITSVKYLDEDMVEQTVSPSFYRRVEDSIVLQPDQSWPATASQPDAVRIRYVAGYSTVPARAKLAVILAVQHLVSIGAENLFLRSDTVEGIGSKTYTVSDAASAQIVQATESLLLPLRVWPS